MHKQNFKHFLDSVKTVLLLSENLTMNKRVQQSDVWVAGQSDRWTPTLKLLQFMLQLQKVVEADCTILDELQDRVGLKQVTVPVPLSAFRLIPWTEQR